MDIHKNARLKPLGRERIVRMAADGRRPAEIAVCVGVSLKTVHKWLARFAAEGVAGLSDRSSRPHRLHRPTPETRVEQIIALRRQRLSGKAKHPNIQDTLGIARRLLDAGRAHDALMWVRKEQRPKIRYSSASDLADGSPPRDPLSIARSGLEAEILDALGDKSAAQALRWSTFEATLDAGMLRQHIAKLADFEEFEVVDRALSHAFAAKQSYLALEFFLQWPHLGHAAKLVVDRRTAWSGSAYYALAPAAGLLDHDHPLAATILYRSLLDDILARAKSAAYGHGARHLAKLDALAPTIEAELVEMGLSNHAIYLADLRKAHGRKSAFWNMVEKRC